MANQDFINTSLFPPVSAIDYQWTDWLNEILPYAGNENINPLLRDAIPNIDPTITAPDFYILSAVGDKRFTMGHMLSAVYKTFIPKIQLYKEVSRAGGCQIINNYICTADGIPIQQVTTACPTNVANPLAGIQPQEVIEFVNTTYASKIMNDIQAFVNYIKTNFINQGYTLTLYVIENFPFFFVQVEKDNNIQFFKYYYEDKDIIAELFNVSITLLPMNYYTSPSLSAVALTINNTLVQDIPVYAQPYI
jgi:hypothetical protein